MWVTDRACFSNAAHAVISFNNSRTDPIKRVQSLVYISMESLVYIGNTTKKYPRLCSNTDGDGGPSCPSKDQKETHGMIIANPPAGFNPKEDFC